MKPQPTADELQKHCHQFDGQRRCGCQATCQFLAATQATPPAPAAPATV